MQAPKGVRMKIRYVFVNGEVSEIEVEEALG